MQKEGGGGGDSIHVMDGHGEGCFMSIGLGEVDIKCWDDNMMSL